MGSQDSFFEALGGETAIGFFTHSTDISRGVDVQGNEIGVKGTCQGHTGDGVQGFGGDAGGNGVVGQGGDGRSGVVGGVGTLGHGGDSEGAGFGPGVVGIDGKNQPPSDKTLTSDIGVFGMGHTGVVGVAENRDPPDFLTRSQAQAGVIGVGTTGVKGTGIVGVAGRGETVAGVVGSCEQRFGVWGQSDFSHGVFADNAESKASGGEIFTRPAGCYGITYKNRGVAGVVAVEGKQNDPRELDPMAAGIYGAAAWIPGENPVYPGNINFEGWAGFFIGPVFIYGGIIVDGFKSAAIRHSDGSHRLLHTIESPEAWFEDFGEARLVKGKADVKLEKEFARVVRTDSYQVFVTPCGDSNGLYVATRNSRGFTVKEQAGGKSTINFAYRIVARRKDLKSARFAKVALPEIRRPTTTAKRRAKGESLPGMKLPE